MANRDQVREGVRLPVSLLVGLALWVVAGTAGAVFWAGSVSEKIAALPAGGATSKAELEKAREASAERQRRAEERLEELYRELQEVRMKVGVLEASRRK